MSLTPHFIATAQHVMSHPSHRDRLFFDRFGRAAPPKRTSFARVICKIVFVRFVCRQRHSTEIQKRLRVNPTCREILRRQHIQTILSCTKCTKVYGQHEHLLCNCQFLVRRAGRGPRVCIMTTCARVPNRPFIARCFAVLQRAYRLKK